MGMFLRRGALPKVTLTLDMSRTKNAKATIAGTEYTSSGKVNVTLEAPITLYATWYASTGSTTWRRDYCYVDVDGVRVATGINDGVGDNDWGYLAYTLTATSNMTLKSGYGAGGESYGESWKVTTS